MSSVTHINYMDQDGNIYCCLRNKVVHLNDLQILNFCSSCKMNEGLEIGKSVHCSWNDVRDIKNPHIVHDPQMEYKYMQKRKSDRKTPTTVEIGRLKQSGVNI